MASGAHNCAPVLGKQSRRGGGQTPQPPDGASRQKAGPWRGSSDPHPQQRPVALCSPERGVAQPDRVLLDPKSLGPHVLQCVKGQAVQARHRSNPGGLPCPHLGSGHPGYSARRGIFAASLPLQYGANRLCVHTVDAKVILQLLRHADNQRAAGVPAGTPKAVNQLLLKWLKEGLRLRERQTEHSLWLALATSHHSDALLHKANWAASQETVLQKVPLGASHAQLTVACDNGHVQLRQRTMRMLGAAAQAAQHSHASTHRGHTPLGRGYASAHVHAQDLTVAAANHQNLVARDGHTPVPRRLHI